MTDWNVVGPLFDRALSLEGEERVAYLRDLEEEDPQVHAEVVSLLEAASGDGPLDAELSVPTRITSGPEGAAPTETPRRIGPWQLEGAIGGGGMGRVFRAHRADGAYDQTVALKILRWEVADDSARARFARERQILARLDHPGITRLLDGGLTEEGLPYLVMEWVDGRGITQACEEDGLGRDRILELFLQVLDAVREAHRAAIIHRDLKPPNILVTDDGQVKLLDFGISKLADEADDELTRTGFSPLTPAWASPEQLEGEPLTTASDIYSLGVILYALLVGHPPHRGDEPSTGELLRRIDQGTVPAPSAALRARGEPARAKALGADLDAVVLSALERDPARRVSSAERFAEDVRRVLEGRPVNARRVGPMVRFAKLVRRHPVPTALLVGMVAVVALSIWAVVSGRIEARQRAVEAQLLGEEVQRIAGRRAILVRDPLHSVSEELAGLAGELEALEERTRDGGLRLGPALVTLAEGWLELGRPQRARELLEEARSDRGIRSLTDPARLDRLLGRAYSELYRAARGDLQGLRGPALEAQAAVVRRRYREPGIEAFARARSVATSEPQSDATGLVGPAPEPGDTASAAVRAERSTVVEILRLELVEEFEEAEALARRHLERYPRHAEVWRLLAELRKDRAWRRQLEGEKEAAMEIAEQSRVAYRRAMEILRSEPRLHSALCELDGNSYELRSQSLVRLGSIEIPESCENAARVHPESAAPWVAHASLHMRQAVRRSRVGGDVEGALRSCIEAAKRAQSAPRVSVLPEFFEAVCLSIGANEGTYDAEESRSRSIELYRSLLEREPNHLQSLNSLAVTLMDRGFDTLAAREGGPVWSDEGAEDLPDPLADHREAQELLERAVELAPDMPLLWNNLGIAHKNQGSALAPVDGEKALAALEIAEETFLRAIERDGEYTSPRVSLARTAATRSEILLSRGLDGAVEEGLRSADLHEEVYELAPRYVQMLDYSARQRLLAVRAASFLGTEADAKELSRWSAQLDRVADRLAESEALQASCTSVEMAHLRAWIALEDGDDPNPHLAAARDAMKEASREEAACAEHRLALALRRARWDLGRGLDPSERVEAALALVPELEGDARPSVAIPFLVDLYAAQLATLCWREDLPCGPGGDATVAWSRFVERWPGSRGLARRLAPDAVEPPPGKGERAATG